MKNTRCEEIVVQLVIRTYDDAGRPVHEQPSNPVKVFRNATTLDFWGYVDKAVKGMAAAAAPATTPAAPKAPAPKARKRGKG